MCYYVSLRIAEDVTKPGKSKAPGDELGAEEGGRFRHYRASSAVACILLTAESCAQMVAASPPELPALGPLFWPGPTP
jgi:hypothetical protein